MNLYQILGLSVTASAEEIKLAYRVNAKIYHPDIGGDAAHFQKISIAYTILSDPEKRRRYDMGEDTHSILKSVETDERMIIEVLVHLFIQLVHQIDVDRMDLVKMMKDHLTRQRKDFEKQIAQEKQKIKRFQKAMKRIKTKNKENIFIKSCESQIEGAKKGIVRLEGSKRIVIGAFDFLQDCTYETLQDLLLQAPAPSAAENKLL
jgi:curved DNA-binding protein CbpA